MPLRACPLPCCRSGWGAGPRQCGADLQPSTPRGLPHAAPGRPCRAQHCRADVQPGPGQYLGPDQEHPAGWEGAERHCEEAEMAHQVGCGWLMDTGCCCMREPNPRNVKNRRMLPCCLCCSMWPSTSPVWDVCLMLGCSQGAAVAHN